MSREGQEVTHSGSGGQGCDKPKPPYAIRAERAQECPELDRRVKRIENAINMARQLGFFDGIHAAEQIVGSVSGVVGGRAKLNTATAEYEKQFPISRQEPT